MEIVPVCGSIDLYRREHKPQSNQLKRVRDGDAIDKLITTKAININNNVEINNQCRKF
jgi:hypothetical protein